LESLENARLNLPLAIVAGERAQGKDDLRDFLAIFSSNLSILMIYYKCQINVIVQINDNKCVRFTKLVYLALEV
jgi:hypothetical protein